MSMGTFDAFTSARLGIYAAQLGLKVTGNNVSNINTEGYTRQRLDQVSFKAGAYDRYRSQQDNHVGSGALVMNINQVRDPYLDVRFRNVSAQVGYNDKMVAGLQEIADILDEVGKGENASDNEKGDGLLHAQIQDLSEKLRAYEKEPTKANNDLVRTSAEILCGMFNKYADRLEVLYQDTVKDFDDQVTKVNECLTNIRDLNREIRDCEIYGDTALELRDERNRQIDELSQYIHIKTVYTEEEIGGGQKVEKLSIYLNNANPDTSVTTDESMLIDGIYGAQLYRTKTDEPVLNPKYDPDVDGEDKKYLDKNGAPCALKDADHVDSPNFDLSISKLVDDKNRDWKGVTTSYEEITQQEVLDLLKSEQVGASAKDEFGDTWTVEKVAEKAIYSFNFTPSGSQWKEGETFKIAGKIYTVGTDITEENANKPEELAKLIAGELASSDKYKDKYIVTHKVEADPNDATKQNVSIQFEAKEAGAIPVSERPQISVSGDDAKKLTFGARQVVHAGVDAVLKPPEKEPTTDPNTGTETKIRYTQLDGKWNKVTTVIKHTREVDLDDNDLHGALQATRELLTEKGEFTSKSTVSGEHGSFDENAAGKRGIPYYQLSLDLLARQFATQYNKLNVGYMQDKDGNKVMSFTGTIKELEDLGVNVKTGSDTDGGFGDGYYVDEKGNFVGTSAHTDCLLTKAGLKDSDTVDDAIKKIQGVDNTFPTTFATEEDKITALKGFMAKHGVDKNKAATEKVTLNGPFEMGGLLFSNRNDRDSMGDPNNLEKDPYITAANISVAHSWSNGDVELVPTYKVLFLDENGDRMPHTTQNDNAGHMLNLIEKGLTYDPTVLVPDAVSTKLFQGNFNDMFSRMNTICGQDIRANKIELNNNYTQQVEIDTQRDGVSGVDLNDEAMNMMQFQKALNAAMRLMTVIDEALDRLINNTGIAGR